MTRPQQSDGFCRSPFAVAPASRGRRARNARTRAAHYEHIEQRRRPAPNAEAIQCYPELIESSPVQTVKYYSVWLGVRPLDLPDRIACLLHPSLIAAALPEPNADQLRSAAAYL